MDTTRNKEGALVISLDFELLWGVWDVNTIENYGNHLLGVQKVIPALLDMFARHQVKATFATVGFLFCRDKAELLQFTPACKPAYSQSKYNVYLKEVPGTGNDEKDDPYHFGYPLFEMLQQSPHEIGTHTFSHYYCLEEGQTAEQFAADVKAAQNIAAAKNIRLHSIVFPRNQCNEDYLPMLKEMGIEVYRGNPTSWIYKPRQFAAEVLFIRLMRLMDTYIPISGYNTHVIKKEPGLPVNVPASRFLKPYDVRFALLEKLKLRRILNEMTVAAKRKELYHLWWHPHNFGINIEKNMRNLGIILEHYQFLKNKYGFTNYTMQEAAAL